MLLIRHDGHHSISLTNSPNGGLHARHLPLQRAFVALLLLTGLAEYVQDHPALNAFTAWFGDRFATGTASQTHCISRILEMESRHGVTPAICQLFVFLMRVAELPHL